MATLQKIRTRAGLLVAIVIGISLAAFILGDMFQGGGSSLFQSNQLEIGDIDGESVQYPQFQAQVEELGEIYRMNANVNQIDEDTWVQLREQTWQEMVHEIIMSDVYDDLGLAVSSDELFDMLQGTNLHPIVQQLFMNQNTGQVDRGAVINFLQNLETGVAPEMRSYWYYLEDQIVNDRIQQKYNNLISQGLYVTSEEAQTALDRQSRQINFDYVLLQYSSVADSQVVVTENEMRDYYNAHKENYEQQKSRRIEYITFEVTPSDADFDQAEEWINDIRSDFAAATDDIQFVNSNSDEGFDDTWYKSEELSDSLSNWIEEGAEVGDVYGPYFENNAYKLSKLHAAEMMPDSVRARHILLTVTTQDQLVSQQELADSLKTAIENGADFAALATQYSQDQGSMIQGGDVGWFDRGQMVVNFENAAFTNDVGEVSVVASEFGIHVVQTTDRKNLSRQYQIATLVRNVVPSTQTYQDVYSRASQFAGENTTQEEFDEAVAEQQLSKRVATVGENDRIIAGLDNARPLIRATYEADEGDMILDQQGSTIFDLGDSFVIATLVDVTEEGVADFQDVRARVQLAVVQENKAELLKERFREALQEQSELEDVATALNTTVESVAGVNFTSVQIPNIGMEPALAGAASALNVDEMSDPIAGNSGVYVIKITSANNTPQGDLAIERQSLEQNLELRAVSEAYVIHQNSAEIEDKRSKFY